MSKHGQATQRHPEAASPKASAGGPELASVPAGRPVPTHEQIALRAYQLWEARGRPEGDGSEDWFNAQRQLQDGSPAAETGGSHHPDPGHHSHPGWSGKPRPTHETAAEQAREARESEEARRAGASNRERMVDIGRGNQQAGRQGR